MARDEQVAISSSRRYSESAWVLRVSGCVLACLEILAVASPAGAQVNRAAAVCVAFEEESVSVPGPLGNILLEHHRELVWRVGLEPISQSDRERLEDALVARLDGRVYIIDGRTCTWSEPGQTHLVVIAYEGVVPQDLSVDPEDPRFQAFGIGYGGDWDEAEAEAVAKARFRGYFDESGYHMAVRETWDRNPPATEAKRGQVGWVGPATELAEPMAEPKAPTMEPGTVFRDCEVCPDMVVVPAGSFIMGSPM